MGFDLPGEGNLGMDRDRHKRLAMIMTRERLALDDTARQEAICKFILSSIQLASQLQKLLDIKPFVAPGACNETAEYLESKIAGRFQELLGLELFPKPKNSDKSTDGNLKSFLETYYPQLQEIPDYVIHRASESVTNHVKGKGVEIAYVDDMASTPMTEEQEKRIAMIISGESLPPASDVMTPSEPTVNAEDGDD